MTASCPCCGGKWDMEGEHYEVLIYAGDNIGIQCLYPSCKREIPYVIDRKFLEEVVNVIEVKGYLKEIERLDEQVKKLRQNKIDLEAELERLRGDKL